MQKLKQTTYLYDCKIMQMMYLKLWVIPSDENGWGH